MATEAIKMLAGIGEPLLGKLLHLDTLSAKFRTFDIRPDPQCALCGQAPTITTVAEIESPASSMNVETIPAADLRQRMESGESIALLDVREDDERAERAIDGSAFIPLGELSERTVEIPTERPLYIHCKAGGRSLKAIELLSELGFKDMVNVEGGIDAW